MTARTNEQWLQALEQPGESQRAAIEELRDYLLRAVLVYLRRHRSDTVGWSAAEIKHFAEDIAQEAILSIRKNVGRFEGRSRFTTWAYRFAINQASNELRLSRYRDFSLEDLQEQDSAPLGDFMRAVAAIDPDMAAERQDCIDLLRNIVDEELTERQRIVVVGVYFQGRSMVELAAQLGTTRNAIYKTLHDARRKIKAQLLGRHMSEGDILALFED